jgi:hypothetical protein
METDMIDWILVFFGAVTALAIGAYLLMIAGVALGATILALAFIYRWSKKFAKYTIGESNG